MENTSNQPVTQQKKKTSGFVIFLIIVGVLIVFFGGFALLIKSSISDLEANIGGKGSELVEKTISRIKQESEGKIALITLHGAIAGSGSELEGDGTMFEVTRRLHKAAGDPDVKAVILQVNSPGGGLTASNLIHNEVMKVKKAGKPVIVWISGLAASGGLYVSAPADWIIACPTSLVGSIGVIMQRMEVKELFDKIGIKVKPIKSTGMKDLGSPFRELSSEEEEYFAHLIESFHEHFVDIVASGRNLDKDVVRELASGKIYTAEESQEYGLIDEIGYFEAATEKAKELAGLSSLWLVKYKEPFDLEAAFKKFPFGGSVSSIEETRLILQALLDMSVAPEMKAVWQVE